MIKKSITTILSAWSRRSLPQTGGFVYVGGLEREVLIRRDRWGVPSIESQSRRDLFFAQGYVHAQDRLWQMDVNRRAANGQLAEVLGPEAVETDRLTRTLGFSRRAETIWRAAGQDIQDDFEAYASGINAFLANDPILPLEFSMLGYEPEPWSVLDSVAFGQLLAWTLSNGWSAELVRARMIDALGPVLTAKLEPKYPERNPITLPYGIEFRELQIDDMLRSAEGPFLNRGIEGSGRGSNAWVISGARTSSGQPILCNDMHLPVPTPSLWYFNRLQSLNGSVDGLELAANGVSQPGLPYVLIGHNQNIAWGATLTLADTEDLFIEKLRTINVGTMKDDVIQYEYQGEWRPAVITEEVIRIKSQPPIVERVISSSHGPVVSSLISSGGKILTLKSSALSNDISFNGFAQLNGAKNWPEFVDAVQQIHAPALNLLYADRAGNIGYYMSGKVPIRANGQGLVPSVGWTGEHEWVDHVPFEEMPHAFNPKAGYIVSANNKIVADDYPYYLGSSWRSGYRAARIEQLIVEQEHINLAYCEEMQSDCFSIPGATLAKRVDDIEIIDQPALEMAELLSAWDGQLSSDSIGGTIYQVCISVLTRKILAPLIGEELLEQILGAGPHPILVPVNEFAGHWTSNLFRLLDNPDELEQMTGLNVVELFTQSLSESKDQLTDLLGNDPAKWRWGKLHYLKFDHLFALKSRIGNSLGHGPYPIGGDSDTIFQNATSPGESYAASSVSPSQRHIIDLADLSRSKAILAPGQSGQLGSKHYGDLVEPWLEGSFFSMSEPSSGQESGTEKRLCLRPNIKIAGG